MHPRVRICALELKSLLQPICMQDISQTKIQAPGVDNDDIELYTFGPIEVW